MKMILSRLAIIILIPCLVACSQNKLIRPGSHSTHGYLIRKVDIFTGVPGSSVLKDMDVFIHEENIAMISNERLNVHGAEVIEGKGRMLLPGLIDFHTHITSSMIIPWGDMSPTMPFNMAGCLYSGVTTVMDLSGKPVGEMNSIAAEIEGGTILGPHLIHCGMGFTAKGGHPIPMLEKVKSTYPWFLRPFFPEIIIQVSDMNDMARVDAHLSAKPDFTKIFLDDIPDNTPKMKPEIVKEIVRRSHEKGIPVMVHIGRNEDVKVAIECGADGIAHDVYKEPLDPEIARALAEMKMFVTPTIYVFHNIGLFMNEKNYTHYTKLEWETMYPSARKALKNPKPDIVPEGDPWSVYYSHFKGAYKETLLHNLKVLKDAGVTIIAGTDAPNLGMASGSALHVELAYLVEGGLTPTEALIAATSAPVKILKNVFHKEVNYGTVEQGKLADLLLVEGDPTKNIQETANIVEVFSRGNRLERNK